MPDKMYWNKTEHALSLKRRAGVNGKQQSQDHKETKMKNSKVSTLTGQKFEEQKTVNETLYDKLGVRDHRIDISNEEIVSLAYLIKVLIEVSVYDQWKISFEEAWCNFACAYKIRDMLKLVDTEYLKPHAELKKFYGEGKVIPTDTDRMNWFVPAMVRSSSV
jgi:hypothetical protein